MMRSVIAAAMAMLGLLAAGATAALADDWQAVKVRGQVLELMSGAWMPVTRNELVPDSRVIRTLATGRVTFVRGAETVDLGPDTQIQIFDKGTAGKPNTTVKQYFGTVSVEAQVEQVQHFAVDTPFLAAVVKGTRFVVTTTKSGGGVAVNRGHVWVTDKLDKTQVVLAVGQSATLDTRKTGGKLEISGRGKLPTVVDKSGKPVAAATGASAGASGGPADGSASSGDNSSGHGVASIGVGGGSNNSSGGGVASVSVGSNGSGGSAASVDVGRSSSNSSVVSAGVGNTSGHAAVDVGTNSKLVDVKVGRLLHLHL